MRSSNESRFLKLDHVRGLQTLHQHPQLMRGMAAPLKCRQVVANLYIVEFYRAQQRFSAQRNPAFLPSKTQDHGVHINRVAHELLGQGVGIKTADTLDPNLRRDGRYTRLGGVLPIAVFDKGCRRCAVAVEGHMRAALTHAQGGFFEALTMGSQPMIRSAAAMPTRVVRMSSCWLATNTWLQVAPPFCASPRRVLRDDAFAFHGAAMPSNWPMVMTPVPPTPATTMPHGCCSVGSAGSGNKPKSAKFSAVCPAPEALVFS